MISFKDIIAANLGVLSEHLDSGLLEPEHETERYYNDDSYSDEDECLSLIVVHWGEMHILPYDIGRLS